MIRQADHELLKCPFYTLDTFIHLDDYFLGYVAWEKMANICMLQRVSLDIYIDEIN